MNPRSEPEGICSSRNADPHPPTLRFKSC